MRPGQQIFIGAGLEQATATICYFVKGRQDEVLAVTAGHACTGQSTRTVIRPPNGDQIGEVRHARLSKGVDIGTIHLSDPGLAEWELGSGTLGSPLTLDDLQGMTDAQCLIVYGTQRRATGTIFDVGPGSRFRVRAKRSGIWGDSGSPAFVDFGQGNQLAGMYLGPDSDRLMRFQHIGPGLNALGLSF